MAEIQKKIEEAFEVFDHDRGKTVDVRYSIIFQTDVVNFSNNSSVLLLFFYESWLCSDNAVRAVVLYTCLFQYFSTLNNVHKITVNKRTQCEIVHILVKKILRVCDITGLQNICCSNSRRL